MATPQKVYTPKRLLQKGYTPKRLHPKRLHLKMASSIKKLFIFFFILSYYSEKLNIIQLFSDQTTSLLKLPLSILNYFNLQPFEIVYYWKTKKIRMAWLWKELYIPKSTNNNWETGKRFCKTFPRPSFSHSLSRNFSRIESLWCNVCLFRDWVSKWKEIKIKTTSSYFHRRKYTILLRI